MKDSKGREYDGWAMQSKYGLLSWLGVSLTRTGLWDEWAGKDPQPNRRSFIRTSSRNLELRAVKVRIVEVGE